MKVISVGRSSSNDVTISDSKVSRTHLQLVLMDNGQVRLADFGSMNGTYVNGRRIYGEVVLNETDVVRIGNTTLRWRDYIYGIGNNSPKPLPTPAPDPVPGSGVDNRRNPFATLGLVFSILAILGYFFGVILIIALNPVFPILFALAIIFNIIGMVFSCIGKHRRRNRGAAITGLVLSIIGFVAVVACVVISIVMLA